MKVLILNDYDEMVGGVEVYNHQLANSLRNRGHSVEIYGGKRSNKYKEFLRSWFSVSHYLDARERIREFNPDVIFAHQIGGNVSPSVLMAGKHADRNIVLKVPNLNQYSLRFDRSAGLSNVNNIKIIFHRPLVRRLTDCWIASSKIVEDQLKSEVGVSTDIHLIRNPVPWNDSPRVRAGSLQSGSVKFIFVGRIDKSKGVEVLIRAFESVVATFPDAKLEIIGRGPDENEITQLIDDSEYCTHINFCGGIPHNDIKQYYANADVLVLPSVIKENSPLAILEAMGIGLPVITTNFGGQQELVDDKTTGLLVEPKSADSLAVAMQSLCEDPNLIERLSKNVSEKASQFSKEQHVDQTERLLENYA